MAVLAEACWISCERWVDAFPAEIPVHTFSEAFNTCMNALLAAQGGGKPRKRGAGRKVLLVAAALLAAAVAASAVPGSREFIVPRFSNRSEYEIADPRGAKRVTSMTVGYVPEGFRKVEKNCSYGKTGFIEYYQNGDRFFTVEKSTLEAGITFDTEEYESKMIDINGFQAIVFQATDDYFGILFNDGQYIYSVEGTISTDELVKIAQNVK